MVYHETVPMMGCQNISMQIFIVDSTSSRPITTTHVPITPNSTLRWFGFSQEGMLVSQDSLGSIRVFSLASNSWTAVTPVGID